MQGQFLIIGSAVVIALIIVIVILHLVRKAELKYYRNKVKNLEIERNMIASTPVLLELSKVEPIIKNDKMEEKYNKWQEKFEDIKTRRLTVIDDMLIDLDIYVDKRDYKNCGYRIASTEIEIYKVRESAEHLLEEIKDIKLIENLLIELPVPPRGFSTLEYTLNGEKRLIGPFGRKEKIKLDGKEIETRIAYFGDAIKENEKEFSLDTSELDNFLADGSEEGETFYFNACF